MMCGMTFEPDPELHDGGAALGSSMTGSVRWFKNEKGYGRINGDDGYVYWVHFSAIEVDGYKTLDEGQRVRFEWHGERADHGRKSVENVRPL
jgi:CspA family cold shock protein